jgi:predicted type IV restriction endonuclease
METEEEIQKLESEVKELEKKLILEKKKEELLLKRDELVKSNKPQTTSKLKRIIRGFKIMYSKVNNSNYVQNIKATETTADPNEFYPILPESKEDKPKKKKSNNEYDDFKIDTSCHI